MTILIIRSVEWRNFEVASQDGRFDVICRLGIYCSTHTLQQVFFFFNVFITNVKKANKSLFEFSILLYM